MFSIYQTTDQGAQTRSHVLAVLNQRDGLTRNEIVAASNGTLTYEQVRRQTENLIFERLIKSQHEGRQRRYYLRRFHSAIRAFCLVSEPAWSVPVEH